MFFRVIFLSQNTNIKSQITSDKNTSPDISQKIKHNDSKIDFNVLIIYTRYNYIHISFSMYCIICTYIDDNIKPILAAINGHLDCLKYAHENGRSWGEETCESAAYHGHLDCLKYAHENGCPLGRDICIYAASNGHLDCLKYAHENGCPWDDQICGFAAAGGHLDCLMYVHKNGARCNLDCNSTTWCEYRCDFCWHRNCDKHDSAKSFRMIISEMDHILYKDVVDVICSFM